MFERLHATLLYRCEHSTLRYLNLFWKKLELIQTPRMNGCTHSLNVSPISSLCDTSSSFTSQRRSWIQYSQNKRDHHSSCVSPHGPLVLTMSSPLPSRLVPIIPPLDHIIQNYRKEASSENLDRSERALAHETPTSHSVRRCLQRRTWSSTTGNPIIQRRS